MLTDAELNIGGTKFKGAWIAVILAIGSTIGGGVWTASSLYSRLEAVEAQQIPDITPLSEQVTLIEQRLVDNDVAQLKGNLAELGSNLKTIMEEQNKLSSLFDRVVEVEKLVTEMQVTVEKAELATENSDKIESKLDKIDKEIDGLWQGMDFLANPYRGE